MIKHSPAKAQTVDAKVSREKTRKDAPTIKPPRPVSNNAQLWGLRPAHNRLGWRFSSRAFHALDGSASRVWDVQDTYPVFVQSILEATPCLVLRLSSFFESMGIATQDVMTLFQVLAHPPYHSSEDTNWIWVVTIFATGELFTFN